MALAREMRKEYELIHARGFVLQLDCPDLAMEHARFFQQQTVAEFVKTVELHVEAINQAIVNIPPDRVRLHLCWGNYDGPHVHDVALEAILPAVLRARVGALSWPLANPRHQHEVQDAQADGLAGHHAVPARRDRHDDQLRRAPGGRRRPHRPGRRRHRRPRPACWPRPIAASAPSPARRRARRAWCGRSCARSPKAPRSPAAGSQADEKGPSASLAPADRTLNVQAVRLACGPRAPPRIRTFLISLRWCSEAASASGGRGRCSPTGTTSRRNRCAGRARRRGRSAGEPASGWRARRGSRPRTRR